LYRRTFDSGQFSKGVLNKPLLRRYLPDSPVVVEAGSYDGTDTEEMSRLWPDAQIYTFEPVPYLHRKVIERVGFRPNVQCSSRALGATTGTATLHVSSGSSDASSSLYPPKAIQDFLPNVNFQETIQVETVTLRDWSAAAGVKQVDLFWFDMQGAEYDVISASPELIQTPTAVLCEVNLVESYEGAAMYDDLQDLMTSLGFRTEIQYLPFDNEGNVLFVNSAK
jgi:FkbM family methyltransferase